MGPRAHTATCLADRSTASDSPTLCVAPPTNVTESLVTALHRTELAAPTDPGPDLLGRDAPGVAECVEDTGLGGGVTRGTDHRSDGPTGDDGTDVPEGVVDTAETGEGTTDAGEGTTDAGEDTTDAGEDASVQLLLTPAEREELFATFRRSGLVADLRRAGVLAIRECSSVDGRLTVVGDRTHAHLCVGDRVETLTATSSSLADGLRERYGRVWATATSVAAPLPPLSTFVSTFADAFPGAARTLLAVVDAETLRRDEPFDPITTVLVVAARHELQTLRVSEWAESVDLASRTEISRCTTRLVDRGVIETNRVPHGIGRPRQVLVPTDGALRSCPPEEILTVARERYASGPVPAVE
ncbi:DUF5821 family protein [Halobaculum sp. MBLA0147]|uniref:transcriptional regulator TbsP domain-containing protein n=1 Tax=Halobaculum sp. MBLA0147 TaxID=3079934 RepID=UPI0035234FC6